MTVFPFFFARRPAVALPPPIARWSLEETSGTSVPDTSGNAWHGTCYNGHNTVGNGPAWINDGTRGKCLSFDGTDDFVGAGTVYNGQAWTFSAWVYRTAPDVVKTIFAKRNSATGSWTAASSASRQCSLSVTASNFLSLAIFSPGGTTSQIVQGTTTVSSNTWVHCVGVYAGSGNVSTVYVNGLPGGTNTLTIDMNTNASLALQLGVRTDNTSARFWQGYLDDARMYDVALTDQQVAALYQQTLL